MHVMGSLLAEHFVKFPDCISVLIKLVRRRTHCALHISVSCFRVAIYPEVVVLYQLAIMCCSGSAACACCRNCKFEQDFSETRSDRSLLRLDTTAGCTTAPASQDLGTQTHYEGIQ